jgi:hypothetical protein
MRSLFLILPFLVSSLLAENSIYTTADFILHLREDSSFTFYPKELSLKTNVAGDYLLRKDSLILTTHEINQEKTIFAIFAFDQLHLELLHFQKEFALSLPTHLDLSKTLYPNQKTKMEYCWENAKQGIYARYTFSQEGYLLAIENYSGGVLHGTQLYYFDNAYSAVESEFHYKDGKRHGVSYYFEPLDETYLRVLLIKKEKYKEGRLRKTKTPATPPIFYTSHF